MRSLYYKTAIAFVAILIAIPHIVSAGNLSLSPSTGSFEVGKNFSLRVTVSTAGQAINAVSGILNFPINKLRVLSVSKAESILTLWIQNPSFSNTQGTISFEGVVPNPGYTGISGTVVLVTFKVLEEGDAVIKFVSGSVLANDGEGTNIARGLESATFNLKPAPAVEEKPIQTEEADEILTPTTSISEIATPPVVESIKSPIFTEYSKKIKVGNILKIKGRTYPDTTLTIFLKDSNEKVLSTEVTSDSLGDFALFWPHNLSVGDYVLTGIVTYHGVKSLPSDSITISVMSPLYESLRMMIGDYGPITSTFIILLAILLVFLAYLFKGFIHFKRKIWRDTSNIEKGVHDEFNELKNAVRKELLVLQNAQIKRSLTREESIVLDRINKHINRIEKNIDRKVAEVKEDLK